MTYNLCTPFKHDIRCASLCGVEFVVTKKRREKRAQRESCLKGVQRLLYWANLRDKLRDEVQNASLYRKNLGL